MALQTGGTSHKELGFRIDFVRHNYDNQQAIIRQLDVKSGVFITLLVFLATGALPLAGEVGGKLHWTCRGAVTSWIYVGSGLTLIAGFLATTLCVQRVVRPRASQRISLSPGLMFSVDVLSHGDAEGYHAKIEMVTEQIILKNLTAEIFQLSAIAQQKTDALRLARWPATISFLAWAVNIAAGVFILTR